jgi:protein-tyrosine-phosphatase/DNA-binding HxlR family transcriptional regulator
MDTEPTTIEQRAAIHAALADSARLRIIDTLTTGDASPSELATSLHMESNLIAHHLNVLDAEGLIQRRRSEGDQRRTYLQLRRSPLDDLALPAATQAKRVLFVCTANSARSHLAVALWRRASPIPAVSAGTHPADRIDPGALAAAARHNLPLRHRRPRPISDVRQDGDLIITVCDLAHENLRGIDRLHWSIADPVPVGTQTAFDQTVTELCRRVTALAPHLIAS